MGFGLFVPEFRSAFAMSTSDVGFVSSLGFLGFFIGLLAAQGLLDRLGPKVPVLSGLAAATSGMATVALAPSLTVLALGVFLAAASAGFAWTPFNDAVHRKIRDVDRPTALSEISTGTSVGIVLAGALALGTVFLNMDWRVCWTLFAVLAAFALFVNWTALRRVEKATDDGHDRRWRSFRHRAAIAMFAVAFVYGTTSAIYISFAADRFSNSGGVAGVPAQATPGLVFVFYGLFGFSGLFAGRVKSRIGLPWLLRLLLAAGALSAAFVALLPDSWLGLIGSAGLQGVNVMMTSAVLAFWSERMFPALPSLSFTAALLATAAGSVVGPALAGLVSDAFGGGAMFLGTAALPAVAAVVLRSRHCQEQPVTSAP